MRGIYVGGSPKMALFTRNADVIRWEFPPSSHAYYTWDVGNAHVYYAWDMRGQKNLWYWETLQTQFDSCEYLSQ